MSHIAYYAAVLVRPSERLNYELKISNATNNAGRHVTLRIVECRN